MLIIFWSRALQLFSYHANYISDFFQAILGKLVFIPEHEGKELRSKILGHYKIECRSKVRKDLLANLKLKNTCKDSQKKEIDKISITFHRLESRNPNFDLAYFLWRHIKGHSSQINFTVIIDARYNEENSGTSSISFTQPTQTKYNGTFVLLHHLMQKNHSST